MKKEVISFRKDIQPGENVTLTERVKWNGAVKQLRIRFYPGVERALHVRPYVLHKAQLPENIITYVQESEQYISGDDDFYEFPCLIPVEYDDEVKVWARNDNDVYLYTLVVDVILQYELEGGRNHAAATV